MKKVIVAIVVIWILGICADVCVRAAVPEACYQYQKELIKQVNTVFGPNAPVASFAAQIQQESGCRPTAVSPVGAEGLTQFMPETARDLAARYPTELGPADPLNWRWAIAAQVRYMHDIVPRPWSTPCDWFAAKLSAYNGGEGWLQRDQNRCRATPKPVGACVPCNPLVWWDNVEITPDPRRAAQYVAENRGYPRRILYALEPSYVAAGWGDGSCHVK